MTDEELLERIERDSEVMGGKPVIRGTRITVEYLLDLLGHGATTEEIVDEYDGLDREDLHAALLFAKRSLADTTFMPFSRESA